MGQGGLIQAQPRPAAPVLVAKVQRRPGEPEFWEVLAAGDVKFDPRPGWVLLSKPIGARPRQRELVWMHPADCPFVWVRLFRFDAPEDFQEPTVLAR